MFDILDFIETMATFSDSNMGVTNKSVKPLSLDMGI